VTHTVPNQWAVNITLTPALTPSLAHTLLPPPSSRLSLSLFLALALPLFPSPCSGALLSASVLAFFEVSTKAGPLAGPAAVSVGPFACAFVAIKNGAEMMHPSIHPERREQGGGEPVCVSMFVSKYVRTIWKRADKAIGLERLGGCCSWTDRQTNTQTDTQTDTQTNCDL